MNDIEFMLKQDAKSKKSSGRGIYGKKGGSKSRKCSLPSDNLSKKELKKMNGECKMYNLSKPMSYKNFCKMPVDLQIEYLEKLRDTYGASLKDISAMMKANYKTLTMHKRRNLNNEPHFKSSHTSRLDELAWARFLAQDCDSPKEGDIKFGHDYISAQEFLEKGTLLSISEGRICLKGKPQNIFRTIEVILEAEGTYEVEFNFTKV